MPDEVAAMRIGFFSDIHGNLDALEAVLAATSGLDALVCLGDLVGYYDKPAACCDLIRLKAIPTVVGNHDQFVLGDQSYDTSKEWLYRVEWTRARLRNEHFRWLRSLPVEMRFNFDGWDFVVRHASPWDVSTYLYQESLLLKEVHLCANECLVIGHTHQAFDLKREGGWILNVGSVGQPRTGVPGADFAVFDTLTGQPNLGHVSYNIQSMIERLRLLDWPDLLIQKLADPHAKNISI